MIVHSRRYSALTQRDSVAPRSRLCHFYSLARRGLLLLRVPLASTLFPGDNLKLKAFAPIVTRRVRSRCRLSSSHSHLTPVECLLIDYILSAKVRVGLVAAVVRKHSNNLAALL